MLRSAGAGTALISAPFINEPDSVIDLQTGTFSLGGNPLILNFSRLSSAATFDGDVISNGGNIEVLAMGNPGTFTITGDLTLDSDSIMNFAIAGTNQGIDYSFLNVGGNVTLDGLQFIYWSSTFTASNLDAFDLIQTGG